MSKLSLVNIQKTYQNGDTVRALNGVTLSFDNCGLVSILGPSGCGKTTLLNVIGGLDRYTGGDLLIDGASTKTYADADWDAYRNQSIGFIFQSYNLIGHLSVLQNVELALSFSSESPRERQRKAKDALRLVGLEKLHRKKPNQLSGGQAQRVAIARALVGNPGIVLADEPTGALDSATGVRVMELLKEISQTRLVIMVTHNVELAREYSTRIIELLDGEVVSDSTPSVAEDSAPEYAAPKPAQTSMPPLAALSLSLRNLLTKKNRTFLTSLAGGIGIIGVALVLALSGGLSKFMSGMQSDALAGYPIAISTAEENAPTGEKPKRLWYPDGNVLFRDDESEYTMPHTNTITQAYVDYIEALKRDMPDDINAVAYSRGVRMNLINLVPDARSAPDPFVTTGMEEEVGVMGMGSTYLQVMPESEAFVLSMYDLVGEGSRLPKAENEIVLVVDAYNQMDVDFFNKLGIHNGVNEYQLTDFIGKSIAKTLPNDVFYTECDGLFIPSTGEDYQRLLESSDGIYLTVTGVLRIKPNASGAYFNQGVVCTQALLDKAMAEATNSKVAAAQRAADYDIHTGLTFADDAARAKQMRRIGIDTLPTAIDIYPKDFRANEKIMAYLDTWNTGKPFDGQVVYVNNATTLTNVSGSLIDTVYGSLLIFACISLAVSGLMIAIITYVSVVERTKEIGILRSLGARKADITRVFEAESLIIGCAAGIIGIAISALLTIPINSAILGGSGIAHIAKLGIGQIVLLLIGSMALTLAAGFIPAKLAARKDPVTALRME